MTAQINEKRKEVFDLKSKFSRISQKLDDLRRQNSQTKSSLERNSLELKKKQNNAIETREDVDRIRKLIQVQKQQQQQQQQQQQKENDKLQNVDSSSTSSSGLSPSDNNKMKVPNIQEYMDQKKELYRLTEEIKRYTRKVELLEKKNGKKNTKKS